MQVKPLSPEPFSPKSADILEFPRTVPETFDETSSNDARTVLEWDRPTSSTAIAQALAPLYSDGSDKSVKSLQRNLSNWFQVVQKAYCWLGESDLRIGSGKMTRYTPFCCQQFEILAQVGKDGYDLWIASVHAANPEKLAAVRTAQQQADVPLSPTEVLPPQAGEPSHPDTSSGIVPYQRSESLAALINARPQIGSIATPDQNPFVLAIDQKVKRITTTTVQVRQELDQARQMMSDTQEAIDALEDLEVVERAQAKADRHYQLEKQVYARRLQELGVQDVLGKSQPASPQPPSA